MSRLRANALRSMVLVWLTIVGCGLTTVAVASDCYVIVDVGHFLQRPGAVSARGVTEFEFNAALAKVIQTTLESRGCRAALIGEQGDIADLKERTTRARGAAFFLSVHHDSTAEQFLEHWTIDGVDRWYSDRFAGFSLFVSRDNVHPERSLRCASAIGARLRSAGFTPSLFHADPAFGEARPFADAANGVHYFDALVVLKTATQPAVLFEAGMLVNRGEELMLQNPQSRERIATAVTDAIIACLASHL